MKATKSSLHFVEALFGFIFAVHIFANSSALHGRAVRSLASPLRCSSSEEHASIHTGYTRAARGPMEDRGARSDFFTSNRGKSGIAASQSRIARIVYVRYGISESCV